MALLGTRVEETAASAETSADKISAVGSTMKALLGQLEDLQRKTTTDVPALENKVLHQAGIGSEDGYNIRRPELR